MEDTVRVSLLGPLEVRSDGRVTAGRRRQAAVAAGPAGPRRAARRLRRPPDRGAVGRRSAGEPGERAAGARVPPAPAARARRRRPPRRGLRPAPRSRPDRRRPPRAARRTQARAASARGDHGAAGDRRSGPPSVSCAGRRSADLLDSWFARDAVARLEELVLAAHEGLVDSELALGRHADVVADLVDLVARHPLRERFRAQLIIALYRSGRQADALQAYRDARQYLLDELGLDPGPELQALERSVLAHDPALAAPIALTPIAAAAPGGADPADVVRRPRPGAGARSSEAVTPSRLTSVVGPGGVGKTRLALELIRRLAERGEVWFVELAPVTQPAGGGRGGRRRRRRAGARPGRRPAAADARTARRRAPRTTGTPSSCSTTASTWRPRRRRARWRCSPAARRCAS